MHAFSHSNNSSLYHNTLHTTQLTVHQYFAHFRVGKFSYPKTTNQLHTKHLDDIAT